MLNELVIQGLSAKSSAASREQATVLQIGYQGPGRQGRRLKGCKGQAVSKKQFEPTGLVNVGRVPSEPVWRENAKAMRTK